MFTLKIENAKGNEIVLTQNESNYQVINVEGLTPPTAQLYTNAVANMDGAKFKSSKLDMRNLVLTIKINGDVEANRINLYKCFGIGKWCKLFYKNDSRDVYIEGYIETIECPLFTVNQQMQINVVAPNPYFNSVEIIYCDISLVLAAFTFPFAIEEAGIVIAELVPNKVTPVINDGEFTTGANIVMRALADNVSTPTIFNSDTGEYMTIDTILNKGDVLRINTNKGSKSIVKIVNGVETNIINYLVYGSTWLQLETGVNNFTYDAGAYAERLEVIFEYHHQYEGV